MVIVAAVDSTDRARTVVEQAGELAEAFDDSIHVVHVMKRSEVVKAELEGISEDEPVPLERLRSEAAVVSSDLIEQCALDIETEAVGLIGDPAAEVVEHAAEHDARYIVVSPERRSKTGKILFGSVAQSVLLDARCPVVSLSKH